MGMMKVTKSVTMFMPEVRYHTGRLSMHFPAMLGTKIVSGMHARLTRNLSSKVSCNVNNDNVPAYSCVMPQAAMQRRSQKQIA
jgi:hypothetical protein